MKSLTLTDETRNGYASEVLPNDGGFSFACALSLCAAGYMATKSNRACQGHGLETDPVSDREL